MQGGVLCSLPTSLKDDRRDDLFICTNSIFLYINIRVAITSTFTYVCVYISIMRNKSIPRSVIFLVNTFFLLHKIAISNVIKKKHK